MFAAGHNIQADVPGDNQCLQANLRARIVAGSSGKSRFLASLKLTNGMFPPRTAGYQKAAKFAPATSCGIIVSEALFRAVVPHSGFLRLYGWVFPRSYRGTGCAGGGLSGSNVPMTDYLRLAPSLACPASCAYCFGPHLDRCFGGCPYNALAGNGEHFHRRVRDPYCPSYRRIFGHVVDHALGEVFSKGEPGSGCRPRRPGDRVTATG